jgi:3-oxoacyl-[acyl-carrier-protein] synthase II
MGAAGTLELAGNIPSFEDNILHPCANIDSLDPECAIPNILFEQLNLEKPVDYILNNSFGMLGINSVLIVKRFAD